MSAGLYYELEATAENLAPARRILRAWLATRVADPVTAADLLAVASEFLLEAIAKGDSRHPAVLRAETGLEGVIITVEGAAGAALERMGGDRSTGAAILQLRPAADDPLAAGGLGRRIVEGNCDRFELSAEGGRLTMRCWRSGPRSDPAPRLRRRRPGRPLD